jgi:hypothetical protein
LLRNTQCYKAGTSLIAKRSCSDVGMARKRKR